MKLGCSSWSFREPISAGAMDLFAFIKEARRLGFRAVELLHSHFKETSHAYLDEIMAVAQSEAMEVSAVSPSNDFAQKDATQRAGQVSIVRSWAQIASDMHVKNVRVFTGYDKEGVSYEDQRRWVIECFRECVPLAEDLDVCLAVENHSSVMRTADELVALMEEIDSPALRMNPDPTNFSSEIWTGLHPKKPGELSRKEINEANALICESNRQIMPYAVHAHLKVGFLSKAGKLVRADYKGIMKTFKDANYDGAISLELVGPDVGDPSTVLAKCVKQLQNLL
ncbi:MAG: sugar phosphate isomerase/epimerase [Planctomycetes bacterium]|nr:sugar phosphate isomerase/epimerase [Planctomycetota bacterium]